MNTISVDDIKKVLVDNYVVYVKYVRVGETYRFALDAEWSTPKHSQMVKKGETATSAGGFKLYRDRFEWETRYSTTLHIGVAQDDEKNLTELFGVKEHGFV
jgi:hypothetical protein